MSRRVVIFLVTCLVTFLVGCGGESDPSGPSTAPGGAESTTGAEAPPAPPPLPKPVEGTFAIPVQVPLAAVAELIDAQLPSHQSEGYRPMTRAGQSPAIEGRYEVWRDPVKVRFDGAKLHVEVPLRYAARFNARMKNPFGGKWMTVARDEPWGTEREPLRVTLHLHTKIDISERWKLSLRTTVDKPVHGPPPEGKLCTGGAFKLCVTKASIAPQVQRQLDAELLSRINRAVADFDRTAERTVALPTRVARVFEQLVRPRPAEHGRWMTLEPKAAALALRADGEAIVAEPALSGRLSYHEEKPAQQAPKLPDRQPLSELPKKRVTLPDAFIPPELQLLRQAI